MAQKKAMECCSTATSHSQIAINQDPPEKLAGFVFVRAWDCAFSDANLDETDGAKRERLERFLNCCVLRVVHLRGLKPIPSMALPAGINECLLHPVRATRVEPLYFSGRRPESPALA